MKTVSNRTHRPIKVPLPGGKALHLGPGKTGQIQDRAADLPALKRLVEAGDLEIHEEGAAPAASGERSGGAQTATHGHIPNTMIRPKGDR
jgi:hypothetical protein